MQKFLNFSDLKPPNKIKGTANAGLKDGNYETGTMMFEQQILFQQSDVILYPGNTIPGKLYNL